MEPQFTERSAFTVVGLKYRGKNENEEIPGLWREFWPRVDEIAEKVPPVHAYGVIDNMDERSGEYDYLAGVSVSPGGDIPEGMTLWEIPAQRYAVFLCTLPTLMETFAKIYQEWLPESGYRRAPGPEFELYDERFDVDQEKYEMFVYIPVEKSESG